MRTPAISVIMCIRDGEKFLSEALDSIETQGIADLEIIVVDDGSHDNSAHVARTHELKPKVLPQQALGIGTALNTAMRSVSSHLVAFLDCDDVWPRGRLYSMLESFQQHQSLDVVFGQIVNTDETLNELGRPHAARLAGAMLIKRVSALKIGEFRTDLTHGVMIDWISRAALLGLRFKSLDQVVLLRRIHGDNIGIRSRPKARADLLRVIRDHLERTRH